MFIKKVFILSVLAYQSFAHDFKVCGELDHLHVSSVGFSSNGAIPGSTLDITISGTPDVTISENAQAIVETRIYGIKMYSETVDLCSEFEVDCPLKSGESFSAKMSYEIPSSTPHMVLQFKFKIVDNGAELGCFETEVDVVDQQAKTNLHYRYLFNKLITEHSLYIDNFETRLHIFSKNLLSIISHNSDNSNTYRKEMNAFGHLTREEFAETRLGYNQAANIRPDGVVEINPLNSGLSSRTLSELPSEVDWVSRGAVTKVKNQGRCGSCWSFSTTGAIEGAYFLKTGKLLSFSEQQLVDCDKTCFGCRGGLMDTAFEWIKDHKGMCLENDYPYVSGNGIQPKTCTRCINVPGSTVKSFVDVISDSEQELMSAVSGRPVSVAIEADQEAFQFYKSGVVTGKCGSKLDHGVLVVGFATTSDGIDYWRIKNSWGTGWGEDGYVRIQRGKTSVFNKSGQCGILKQASYPVLV